MTVLIKVSDVDGVHANADSRGYPIKYPLAARSWRINSYFLRVYGIRIVSKKNGSEIVTDSIFSIKQN